MIKLHSKGISSDYTEYGGVSTDCKTVGKFITQASAIFGGHLIIKVDGCRYDLFDNPKMRATDDTPIDEVTYACIPGRMTFIVRTRPQPKTVRKSGFVNIYRTLKREYVPIGKVYGEKDECKQDATRNEIILNADFVSIARIEWEEER